jgi:hypothetical protein
MICGNGVLPYAVQIVEPIGEYSKREENGEYEKQKL